MDGRGGGANDAYIMGPDLADYELIAAGGRLGDMRAGDGGQAAIRAGAEFAATIKRRWLFDLERDPTGQPLSISPSLSLFVCLLVSADVLFVFFLSISLCISVHFSVPPCVHVLWIPCKNNRHYVVARQR
eukprot:COSAG06_NODE_8705_length_2092_cov_1.343703_2_plen_130_part_00